jgi:hypothetical protein
MYVYVCMCLCIFIHTYIHTYIYIYMHAYIYTVSDSLLRRLILFESTTQNANSFVIVCLLRDCVDTCAKRTSTCISAKNVPSSCYPQARNTWSLHECFRLRGSLVCGAGQGCFVQVMTEPLLDSRFAWQCLGSLRCVVVLNAVDSFGGTGQICGRRHRPAGDCTCRNSIAVLALFFLDIL